MEEIKVILVTGDRNWSNVKRISSILSLTDYTILVEGECRGADRLAAFIARSNGKEVIGKAADWKDGKKGGVMRNKNKPKEVTDPRLALYTCSCGNSIEALACAISLTCGCGRRMKKT